MPEPVVQLRTGAVRGTMVRETAVFYGIPYGQATDGERRFKPPLPALPWSGVRDATTHGPATVQQRGPEDPTAASDPDLPAQNPMPMSEDSLIANVYTRGLGDGGKRPVMMYLHGGGFRNGVGATVATDGVRLTERGDVVVVSINHRLNVYGFLSLVELCGPEFDGSGQAGMLDIILALHWVRENIEAFGGDPNNVTLFGVSGGGRKISQLLGMPAARGLFQRGIIQSGAHPRGVPQQRATDFAQRFLDHLGIAPSEIHRLQAMPWPELNDRLYGWLKDASDPATGFGIALLSPSIDGKHMPADAFGQVAAPSAQDIPIIIGTTRHESAILLSQDPAWAAIGEDRLIDEVEKVVGTHAASLIAAVRENRPGATPYDVLVALGSEDRRRLSLQIASRHAAAGSPVYFYQFAWESNHREGRFRAAHSLDTTLVFDNPDGRPMTGTSPTRYDIAALMADTWIAFARNGDPNHEGLPHWDRFNEDTRHQMVFDLPPHAEQDWDRIERLAWRDVDLALPFEGRAFVGAFTLD